MPCAPRVKRFRPARNTGYRYETHHEPPPASFRDDEATRWLGRQRATLAPRAGMLQWTLGWVPHRVDGTHKVWDAYAFIDRPGDPTDGSRCETKRSGCLSQCPCEGDGRGLPPRGRAPHPHAGGRPVARGSVSMGLAHRRARGSGRGRVIVRERSAHRWGIVVGDVLADHTHRCEAFTRRA
jgi:hypothetical protein